MHRVLLCVLLFLIPALTWCQVEHFVYIQTDYKQPFYVRTSNKKIYSSSENGHLILGRLTDSSIQIIVGFAKNAFDEQQFTIPLRKDAGFLLKNFGEEGWGLFNLQTLELIKNSNQPADKKTSQVSGTKKTDRFSTLLANAVNDTAILYTAAVPSPPPVLKTDVASDNSSAIKKAAPDSASIAGATIPKPDTLPPAKPVVIATAPIPEIVKKDTITRVENKKTDTTSLTIHSINRDTITSVVREKIAVAHLPETIKKDTNAIIRESIPPIVQEQRKKDQLNEQKTDSLATVLPPLNKDMVQPGPTVISKAAEILTDTSYIAVFVDNLASSYDTIRVSIPFDESKLLRRQATKITEENDRTAVSEAVSLIDSMAKRNENEKLVVKQEVPTVKPDSLFKRPMQETPVPKKEESPEVKLEKNTEKTGIEIPEKPVAVKKDSSAEATIDTAVSASKKKIPIPNSDCKLYASETDVDKLRVKMMGQKTDDDKLAVARKVFKQRCFTTRHIKGLSELFTTEDGKYRWLDTAYPFVSDPYNFESAIELLKDEYFINRFKAMIRHVP
jgi:Domain of unknown function (DUF4476)